MASATKRAISLSSPPPSQRTTTSNFHLSTILLYLFAIYIFFSVVVSLAIYRIIRVLTRPQTQTVRLHPRQLEQSQVSRQSATLLSHNSHGHSHSNGSGSGSKDQSRRRRRRHLLIVLGSGGHTSEMLSILHNLGAEYLNTRFAQRTWVVSTGDGFSAERASRFEEAIAQEWAEIHKQKQLGGTWIGKSNNDEDVSANGSVIASEDSHVHWDIVTVTRARKVHQPLYTTPISALACLWDCIRVLRGSLYMTTKGDTTAATTATATATWTSPSTAPATSTPDLILTNGPGTGVMVVLASLVLLALGLAPLQGRGSMRCVYVESWARVKTLSLSGKMLRWIVSRFLVQWRGLADVDATAATATTSVLVDESEGRKRSDADAVTDADIDAVGASASVLPRRIEFVGAVVT